MEEPMEVMDAADANYVVIISEAYGLKRVIKKIYFSIPRDCGLGFCFRHIAENYEWCLSPQVRTDIYKVFNGRTVARG